MRKDCDIFPTPENFSERNEQVLVLHIEAANLCAERREAEALPLLRRVVRGLGQLMDEQPGDAAVFWRFVLALHSLGISALVTGRQGEAAMAATTALIHARRARDHAQGKGLDTVEEEIAKLEKLCVATGPGIAYVNPDGDWPFED